MNRNHALTLSRILLITGLLLVWVAGCGDVKVQPVTSSQTDTVVATDVGDGLATGDTLAGDTVAVDAVGECITDLDCSASKMLGKTPCNLPKCDKSSGVGKCVWKLRDVGEACVDPTNEPGECETSACDAQGACVKTAKAEGSLCGLGTCGKKCSKGVCIAATAADYDDKNPCTTDYCDQGKEVKHDPVSSIDAKCDDNNLCTADDICVAGACKGTATVCNDNIPCTVDSCDPAKGCLHVPDKALCTNDDPCVVIGCDLAEGCTKTDNAVGTCDDSNPCTTSDTCVLGKCSGKSSDSCGCTSDAACAKFNTACGGKFACTIAAGAKSGVCTLKPETVVVCADTGSFCSVSQCDDTSGVCVVKSQNDAKVCDDGNLCTATSTCQGGSCVGKAVSCDDGNPCTADSCEVLKGCVHTTSNSACDDGNPCTVGDLCSTAGVCEGAKKSCDDGIACTYDSCEAGNCVNKVDNAGCDDKNPCTTDTCVAGKGCSQVANDAGVCPDDGDPCTTESCKGGSCQPVNVCQCKVNTDCDDKNPCTVDTCSAGKCNYANAPATQTCTVANKCIVTGTGMCSNGVCTGGKPVDCSTLVNACNNAQCNPNTGGCEAIAKADGTPCDADGNGCTVNDACKSGKCAAGGAANCPAVACNDVACKSTAVNTYICDVKPQVKGAACNDGLFCTVGDACDGLGKCASSPYPCASATGGPTPICTQQVCDEASKSCLLKPSPSGTACDDGKFCTSKDTCDGQGQCLTVPTDCGFGKGCKQPVCDETTNMCISTVKSECCTGATLGECDDGQICTEDSCEAANLACVHKANPLCCNSGTYSNDFEELKLKSLEVNNSANYKQGWQLTPMPDFCLKVPACAATLTPGKNFLYYGDLTTGNFDFGTSMGTVQLPIVTVPKEFKGATLKFNLYMLTEGGGYDDLMVMVQPVNEGPDTPILPPSKWPLAQTAWQKSTSTYPMGTWQGQAIDLMPALTALKPGTKYAVILRFNTKDQINNATMGVLIDGLALQIAGCSYWL